MADKQKIEIDLDTKDAEKKIGKLESGLRKLAGKIEAYTPGQHFQEGGALSTFGAAGKVGGAIGGKIGGALSYIPGYTDMASQYSQSLGKNLAPNVVAAMRRTAAPLEALDETIAAFGSAKGSQKSLQGLYDAKLRQKNRVINVEAFNREQISIAGDAIKGVAPKLGERLEDTYAKKIYDFIRSKFNGL